MDTIKITYDNVGNTLDIWFTKPSKNKVIDSIPIELSLKNESV